MDEATTTHLSLQRVQSGEIFPEMRTSSTIIDSFLTSESARIGVLDDFVFARFLRGTGGGRGWLRRFPPQSLGLNSSDISLVKLAKDNHLLSLLHYNVANTILATLSLSQV